jgi:predicted dehydrogenase
MTTPITRRELAVLATGGMVLRAAQARPIRCAVIGTGHGHAISKIRALRSMPEYELAGVARPDPRETDQHEVLRGVKWTTVDAIASDRSIEMAAIETADFDKNLEYAERMVAAGKFLHFDKPPGADLRRLKALLDEAARRGRVVQMGYQWRYHPAMQAVLEAARQGWLGQVYRFRASIDKLVEPEEREQLARHKGGLMFSEGCHLIDRAVDLLGTPERAVGFLRQDSPLDDGLMDNTLAVLEFPGALAEISLAGFHERGGRYRYLEVQGTNGFARMQPYAFPSTLTVDLARAAGPYAAGFQSKEIPAPPGLAYTPDFRELAAIMREGARPQWSAAHDLAVHETLLRVCGMLNPA